MLCHGLAPGVSKGLEFLLAVVLLLSDCYGKRLYIAVAEMVQTTKLPKKKSNGLNSGSSNEILCAVAGTLINDVPSFFAIEQSYFFHQLETVYCAASQRRSYPYCSGGILLFVSAKE